MCTIYVPTYYLCVLILIYMCPHANIYVPSYYYICFLMLLYVCPHAAIEHLGASDEILSESHVKLEQHPIHTHTHTHTHKHM